MEAWKRTWREGLSPLLSTRSLEALRQGLIHDDARLIQHATTTPPPTEVFFDEECEGACALGYSGWQGNGLYSVREVEEFFVHACTSADEALGELAACRHFLNWFDETPRTEMRRELLREVNWALNQRLAAAA